MAATPLARFNVQNGTPLSVTIDSVYPLSQTEFFITYTASAVQYGDVFTADNFIDQLALIESYNQSAAAAPAVAGSAGSGSGTTLNAILFAGGPTATAQPRVAAVTRVIS